MKENTDLPYKIIVGLEIHVELKTKTKMFCRCLNQPFGSVPNSNICPNCMGLPGSLPVPNKEAIRKSIIVGKALGSTIAKVSKWDRKHYFYPDLPKGYQISQYDLPLCVGGKIELLDKDGSVESVVRFERAHLEEDAGKLMHGSKPGYSNVDLNRAGVPLLEMVSKPDITSGDQARRFMQELRLLVRTLGVSDGDMEKGQMRCDVNVNIKFEENGKEVRTPITEIKNVNSTRAVERSVNSEAQRQYDEWRAEGPIRNRKNKITVGWDENTETVQMQRAKEDANDYRYFPEPDIPPVNVYEIEGLNPDQITLPELPNQTRLRYISYGMNMSDIEVLLNEGEKLSRFVELTAYIGNGLEKQVANWLINAPESAALNKEHFKELMELTAKGMVSFASVKPRVSELAEKLSAVSNKVEDAVKDEASELVKKITAEMGLLQMHDDNVVKLAIENVISEHKDVVEQFIAGNEKVFGFLVGQVMKRTAGKSQPAKVSEALKEVIKSKTK